MWTGRLLAGGGAALLLLFGAFGWPAPAASARLPDLVATLPQSFSLQTDEDGRIQLGFRSSGENIGAGPLILEGTREDGSAEMSVEQLVTRTDGSIERHPVPAVLHYENSSDHSHWHYDDFMAYELRDTDSGDLVRPAHKTGFCLGDRYKIDSHLPDAPSQAVYTEDCGPGQPAATRITEGISVGYGDDYLPHLEGQSIDLTGVPDGTYRLVHHVNPDRSLIESDYGNNVASVLIRVVWSRGPDEFPEVFRP